jgi:hypothetical protein
MCASQSHWLQYWRYASGGVRSSELQEASGQAVVFIDFRNDCKAWQARQTGYAYDGPRYYGYNNTPQTGYVYDGPRYYGDNSAWHYWDDDASYVANHHQSLPTDGQVYSRDTTQAASYNDAAAGNNADDQSRRGQRPRCTVNNDAANHHGSAGFTADDDAAGNITAGDDLNLAWTCPGFALNRCRYSRLLAEKSTTQ